MFRRAVGVAEAGIHDAGGGNETQAEGNRFAIDRLTRAELGLRGFAGVHKFQCVLQIVKAIREAACAGNRAIRAAIVCEVPSSQTAFGS